MKIVKIILGLILALVLLVGGFVAGTFLMQTRATTAFLPQPLQLTLIQQQPQGTPAPQTTAPAVPPHGQQGWGTYDWNHDNWDGMYGGMMNGYSWQTNPNVAPQGQSGWGMHDRNGYNLNGMHGGMMNGNDWQTKPNTNPRPNIPNGSPTYPTPSTPTSFKDNVQPIFSARCIACHGGTDGLSLNTYENVMKGGVDGAVVIPGDVYNSRLAYYVYSGYMPFRNTPLTSGEVQTILDWIATGAPNN